MIAVQIADIGSFMTKFLRSEIFDPFEFMEGTLQTRITYDFDGHILSDSYSEDELREEGLFGHTYLPFSMQRPVLFDLIKGKKTPVFFKFTLFLSPLDFWSFPISTSFLLLQPQASCHRFQEVQIPF